MTQPQLNPHSPTPEPIPVDAPEEHATEPVSYTHLTLPTICSV